MRGWVHEIQRWRSTGDLAVEHRVPGDIELVFRVDRAGEAVTVGEPDPHAVWTLGVGEVRVAGEAFCLEKCRELSADLDSSRLTCGVNRVEILEPDRVVIIRIHGDGE